MIIKNNAPIGCLTEWINRMSWNLVTYTLPNISNLYDILENNFFLTNYTKKFSNKTTSIKEVMALYAKKQMNAWKNLVWFVTNINLAATQTSI